MMRCWGNHLSQERVLRGAWGTMLRNAPECWGGCLGKGGLAQESRERVQSGNKGTPVAGERLLLWLKALGNNNQDLSLGNHHSNIKTQVGERCFPVEPGGQRPTGGFPRPLPPVTSPKQEGADAEQSLAGKAGFKWRRKELSQPPLSPLRQQNCWRQR